MTGLTVDDLVVRFGDVTAVDRVSLSVAPGELLLLLGPSGCGKTTFLRAVAGFVEASAGRIRFGDQDVTRLPAHARNAGLVFQSFALWPHMNVGENVAFGLREQGTPRPEIAERVEQALASVELGGFAGRRIDQLSGGEQQRVALARALIVRPRCLLLDEPLANLDARLRRAMRDQIRRICKSFGLASIYVTHDQKEALSVADRIAVMQKGRLLQVGSPREVYRRPASRSVAEFLGETNLIAGDVVATDAAGAEIACALGRLRAADPAFRTGDAVWISIRPESFRMARDAGGSSNRLSGVRQEVVYLGDVAEHRLQAGEQTLLVTEANPGPAAGEMGETVTLEIAPEDVVLLAREKT
ncbi:MAG TPA: ABC transporter ATP-binding protein [Polyangia bacterium]|nr:ABC transporter ATP-binding protein [Polyangia bacterium]